MRQYNHNRTGRGISQRLRSERNHNRDPYSDRYERDYPRENAYRNNYEDEYERRSARDAHYDERDSDIYEDEFEQEQRYSRRPSINSGYGRVRGLRNSNSRQDPGEYEQNDRNDQSYDYSSDPYYRDDEDDYAYAGRYRNENRNNREHAPLDEEGRWEYGPRSRSPRRSLNRRTRSDFYNGLSNGYDY